MKLASVVVCVVLGLTTSTIAQDLEHQVMPQASVGQTGREIAFLNCVNPDQADVSLSVRFVRPRPAQPILRDYPLGAEDRLSINIAHDVPELGQRAYFSVIIAAEADDAMPTAATCDITWHRAVDLHEVESRHVVIRRSPKR